MQPFELSGFSVPCLARLNPDSEEARVHAEAWAHQMGPRDSEDVGGSAIRDERTFDSMDFALLTSYARPDALDPKVVLATGWYVRMFSFDDRFLETSKRTQDLGGAKEYLDRLLAFTPVNPARNISAPDRCARSSTRSRLFDGLELDSDARGNVLAYWTGMSRGKNSSTRGPVATPNSGRMISLDGLLSHSTGLGTWAARIALLIGAHGRGWVMLDNGVIMQHFKMPEFYMPWPARVNPHLEEARVHAKAWARDTGMLGSPENADGSGIWDEPRFDSVDCALLVALAHPDAPAPELELLSDWYVWFLYVHDSSRVFDGHDVAGAREYVSRLPGFMPVDLTATPPEEPTNPVERGLADLWPRTVPTKSAEWRHRFSEHIRSQAEEAMRECFNLVQDKSRVLDPIEYIDVRRQAGGWSWKADLVEHALGVEIPPELYRTRPIRVLNETFADSAHLRMDILSYQRDIDEGKVNNGVAVVENFLDCDLQRAVDTVNNFVTSRLYQFEDTTVTELFPLFEEYETGLLARAEILTYVKGLRDWMAGNLEWVRPSGCYSETGTVSSPTLPGLPCGPTGLGTVAARLGLSPAAVGLRLRSYQGVPYRAEPYELPQFYMPFSARLNPHLNALRTHAKAWAREMGLLGPIPDARGKYGRWDEDKWDSGRFELLSALLFPDAQLAELELANDWYVWVFYMKDYFLECFKRRRDLLGARAFLSRLPAFAPAEGTATPVPTNPVERALADLWSRGVKVMSAGLRRPLAGFVEDLAEALLRELTTLVQNRTPDPLDFEEMRRSISTATLAQVLIPYTLDLENPPEIYLTSPMCSLAKAFEISLNAYVDIFAYEPRVNWHHDFNTGVVVMQRFFDCDVQQAVDVLNKLGASRLRQFEYTVTTELPVLFDELDLDTSARDGVLTYVEGLQAFMAGWLEWLVRAVGPPGGLVTSNHDVKTASFMVPTGLGTSAARIGSLSGVGSPEPVSGTKV